jgi:hypothetical protein
VYRWSNLPDQLERPEELRDLSRFHGFDADDDLTQHGDDAAMPCGDRCFWVKQNRRSRLEQSWSEHDRAEFNVQLLGWGSSLHGPCYMAMAMGKPCNEVFVEMLRNTDSPLKSPSELPSSEAEPKQKLKAWYSKAWYMDKEPTRPHFRSPFVPCSHEGSCDEARCSCFSHNVPCEKTCACNPCDRAFRGCDCRKLLKGGACRAASCQCLKFDRECDEDLCGDCGAADVLNPINRGAPLHGVCANVAIQKGVMKRTLRGTSEVSGFGYFAAEKIKAGDFIGEYLGALTTTGEANRRGILYHSGGALYEAGAGTDRTLDATRAGNKTRYMNNAHSAYVINVNMKLMVCSGIVREAFYASRDIEPGEELFFDYHIQAGSKEIEGFKEKSLDGHIGPISERVLGTVVRTKVCSKKSQGRNDRTSGVLESISNRTLEAFHAEDSDLSSSDVDPMELDLGDVPVGDEHDNDYTSTSDGSEGDDAEDVQRRTRSSRRLRRKPRDSDDEASVGSPSRGAIMATRSLSRRGGGTPSRQRSAESEDLMTTRAQKRKRQSSGLGGSFLGDSD